MFKYIPTGPSLPSSNSLHMFIIERADTVNPRTNIFLRALRIRVPAESFKYFRVSMSSLK